jgi:peptidyl-prolyl cis-trans isomerase SurA
MNSLPIPRDQRVAGVGTKNARFAAGHNYRGKTVKERMIEKHISKDTIHKLFSGALIPAALAVATLSLACTLSAQTQQQPKYQMPGAFGAPAQLQLPQLPATTPITPNGAVVEDVVARVNDQIITRSEYEQALNSLLQEARRQNATEADFDSQRQNLLRDMIDQQILLSKGKELGITGDAEMMHRLDDIRKENHLDSMEALEKAAASQGVSFEDFKQGIRNNAITQQVVRDEVGRHMNMTHAEELTFYNAHLKDFEVPEQVHLSEILTPTPDNATDAQIADAKTKADALEAKLVAGANFADLAKSSSGGPTASAGGDLGDFKRGTLGAVLENATFPLAPGKFTEPIRTRQGFVILRVDTHQAAGTPPLDSIEGQVQEGLYMEQLQPALRQYLTKARQDLYVDIATGFVDSGAVAKKNTDQFTAYKAPAPKKKTVKHQRIEQQKAATAQAELATARAKVAQKNAEKAAATASQAPTAKNVSRNSPSKPKKIQREKIRYGQAPRNSLPSAPSETATVNSGALAGQAPGVAMAMTASTTTISTGTGVENDENPLAPKAGPQHKSRIAARQDEENAAHLQGKLKKAEVKAETRPVKADQQSTASEKIQAAPLGLNGDTEKKKKKPAHVKGQPKERLQEQPSKPVDNTPAPAPTANPALVTTPTGLQHTETPAKPAPSADRTTLPPTYTPAPGAPPQGQPLPATTSADPNAPVTTPAPH